MRRKDLAQLLKDGRARIVSTAAGLAVAARREIEARPLSAYVISDVEILDQELIVAYRTLARGGAIEAIEGGWTPKALIIVEFPDMARARAWYHSPEHAEALTIRVRRG